MGKAQLDSINSQAFTVRNSHGVLVAVKVNKNCLLLMTPDEFHKDGPISDLHSRGAWLDHHVHTPYYIALSASLLSESEKALLVAG